MVLLTGLTRYYLLTGGRGSAKSFHVADFLLKLTYEQGHLILFTRYTMKSAHLSIFPEFIEKMDLYGVKEQFEINKSNSEITNVLTGSKIVFRGIKTSEGNQTANLKSIQGVTTWVLDEAEELVEEEDFDKIDESIRKKGVLNRIIMILNPTTKNHWIHTKFFVENGVKEGSNITKGDTTYIHTTYKDNKENLSESFLAKIEKLKRKNYDKYAHRILGGWLDKLDGVVFENWEYGEYVNCGQEIFGQDYGDFPDPTTLIKVSIDKKRKKIYVKECFSGTKLSEGKIIENNKDHAKRALIVADGAEPRLIRAAKKAGVNIIAAKKGPGSVASGIKLLRDYQIIVDPESVEIAKEFNHYVYSDRKSNLVIDDWNHRIDPLRYCVTHQLKKSNRKAWIDN